MCELELWGVWARTWGLFKMRSIVLFSVGTWWHAEVRAAVWVWALQARTRRVSPCWRSSSCCTWCAVPPCSPRWSGRRRSRQRAAGRAASTSSAASTTSAARSSRGSSEPTKRPPGLVSVWTDPGLAGISKELSTLWVQLCPLSVSDLYCGRKPRVDA